jgi:hypothetical protein
MGVMDYSEIRPGSKISGIFTIENSGEPLSNLDWEIIEYPDWGSWEFSQSEGENLKPQSGPVTIEVSVIVPEEQNHNFSGEIKVVNTEDDSDFDILPVSLSTRAHQNQWMPLFHQLLEVLMARFPLATQLFLVYPLLGYTTL